MNTIMIKQKKIRYLGNLLPIMKIIPPGPKSRAMAKELSKVEMPNCSTIKKGIIPIFWAQAKGANAVDVDGNLYIDLTAASCVATAGHCNAEVVAAIRKQASQLMHTQGFTNPCEVRLKLCQKLKEIAPGNLGMTHLASGGAEAIEVAYKTAKLYTGRRGVIAFHHGFHGKTGTALTLTSKDYYRQDFLPMISDVIHLPYAYCYRCPFGRQYPDCDIFCAKFVEYALDMPDSGVPKIGMMVFEPVIGHGGWIVPPVEFVKRIANICKERNILLIADEIITGFGRTGKMFACEHFGIVPDIIVLAKSMSSGFPISAVVTTKKIGSIWSSGQHTSTFMGNPLGSAAALASINYILKNNLINKSETLGNYFKKALLEMTPKYPMMGDVRGLGLMVGIEVVKPDGSKEPCPEAAREITNKMHEKGLMASNLGGTFGNMMKFSPPLVITKEQLDYAIKIIDESFKEIGGYKRQ